MKSGGVLLIVCPVSVATGAFVLACRSMKFVTE